MNDLEDTFFHLKHLPLVDAKHAELAINSSYTELPVAHQHGIQNTWASAEEFSDSKFCRDLRGHFGECAAVYLRNTAMTAYDWHIDYERKTCINIPLVQPDGALTLHKSKINRLTCHLKVCDYELFRPTVFNATILHCVLNPSNQDRYILTVSVGNKPKYNDLKNWLINYNLDSY